MSVTELSAVLWRERELLELLMFKLEEKQRVISTGHVRWLGYATREVEQVLDKIRAAELERAVEANSVARGFDITPAGTLAELASAAPQPWNELLSSHLEAFATLTDQIQDVARENRELLATSLLATSTATSRAGDDSSAAVYELRMQEIGYRGALGATARVLQPSLLAFVSSPKPTPIA